MLSSPWARSLAAGACAACALLLFEAAKPVLLPGLSDMAAAFGTILFATLVVVVFGFILQARKEPQRADITQRKLASRRCKARNKSIAAFSRTRFWASFKPRRKESFSA